MESIRWQKNNLKQYFEDDDYSEDEVMRIYLPYRFKLKKPEKNSGFAFYHYAFSS